MASDIQCEKSPSINGESLSWNEWENNFKAKTDPDERNQHECNKQRNGSVDSLVSSDQRKNECTIRLRREDSKLFGYSPVFDPLVLVVCEQCSQILKLQALKEHLDLRHPITQDDDNNGEKDKSPVGCESDLQFDLLACHDGTMAPPADEMRSLREEPSAIKLSNESVVASSSPSSSSASLPCDRPPAIDWLAKRPDSRPAVAITPAHLPVAATPPPAAAATVRITLNGHDHRLQLDQLRNHLKEQRQRFGESPIKPEPVSPGPTVFGSAGIGAGAAALTIGGGGCDDPLLRNAHIRLDPNSGTIVINDLAQLASLPKKEKLLPCKERVFDPDKHCGVHAEGKPCTRSLTCKVHPVSLRRAVSNRTLPFDQLLLQHKQLKTDTLKRACKSATSLNSVVHHHPQPQQQREISQLITHSTQPLTEASNHTSVSPTKPKRTPTLLLAQLQNPVSCPVQQQSIKLPQLIDENHIVDHPRPLAACAFNGRQLGGGVIAFGRKSTTTRSVFVAAIEGPPTKRPKNDATMMPSPDKSSIPAGISIRPKQASSATVARRPSSGSNLIPVTLAVNPGLTLTLNSGVTLSIPLADASDKTLLQLDSVSLVPMSNGVLSQLSKLGHSSGPNASPSSNKSVAAVQCMQSASMVGPSSS